LIGYKYIKVIQNNVKNISIIFYSFVLLGWLSLIVGGTWYDIKFTEKEYISTFQNVILNFSARQNFKTIFQMNDSHPELKSLYIIRLASSMFVLCIHYMMRYLANPTINLVHLEEVSIIILFSYFI